MDNNRNAKVRVREVLTESVREEIGLSPEVFEALENVLTETVAKVLEDVLQENEEMIETQYEILLDKIFDEYTRGLSITQKDKLRKLSDNSLTLDPSDPFADYRLQLSDLIDAMFPRKTSPQSTGIEDEYFSHNPEAPMTVQDPMVKAAIAAANWSTRDRVR